ncbi:cytochrome P450 [Haloarcula pellucida]|uniref:Cytochrome P450 n=1 Tax=Haloarcula pellucida TaxID=1427151 RepID=A0A830GQ02_9EURY|nr:cytochrome P450 [Halomicroarcula pellucida]MBX0350029.1 cytochrome P450 [Halomicroarcula pellucida]GGN95670.1 cytochrome P450 [Halomicroarcula pellucida]
MSQTPSRLDGVPILGNAHQAINPLDFVEQCRDHPSPVVRAHAGPKTLYVVVQPRLVRDVLNSRDGRYRKPEHIRYGIDNFGGEIDPSVVSQTRSAWEPVMSSDGVQAYAKTLTGLVDEFLSGWDTGTVRNVHEEFRELCLRLACELFLDVESPLTGPQYSEMVDGFSQRFSPKNVAIDEVLPDWVPRLSQREHRTSRAHLKTFLDGLPTDPESTNGMLLSSLLDASADPDSKISESLARNEVGVLLIGAMEPFAVGLAIACHQMAVRPDVQAEMHWESREVVEGTTASLGDIRELQYTEQVFRETLRLHPPLYTMFRETAAAVSLGPYDLESGAQVWLPQWAIHRDASHFDDPETYDPTRWAGENDHSPFAYFPFGGGPRHCPARRLSLMLAKLVLATIALRYEVTPATTETLAVRPELALRPTSGVDLVFSGRE